MPKVNLSNPDVILQCINDGLYVVDTDRRILYWSPSAERITGWSSQEVVGHRCKDDILCHIDKDGRLLCGDEFCPLHRCMVTDTRSSSPIIVFSRRKSGGHIAVEVSVAPIHDEQGRVVGGVETFRDFSDSFADQERARRIQTLSLENHLPIDPRISFDTLYLPHDMIGGDFYSIRQLDADHYGFFLADVMGHGEAAALHTMQLSSLWNRHCQTLRHPAQFARLLNQDLCKIVQDESFATGVCGIVDLEHRRVRIASAGGPSPVMVRAAGQVEPSGAHGFPFGMLAGSNYHECELRFGPGDSLLLFTDGAFEVSDAAGDMLGVAGLINILSTLGHPKERLEIEALEKALLGFSNEIRLGDDLTLIDIRFS
jgi:phosphoserine phosphatase RsbU/P